MKLACALREIRGDRSLRDVAETAGVNRGLLSDLERGRRLAPDRIVRALEVAYGQPAHAWYPPEVLLVIQRDEEA
ncbi:MAG: helix-turn-helix transcriptional regulator [Thermoleophilia bacterium]